MEENDIIIWKEMSALSTLEKKEETEPCKMDSYPSLYLELKEKCNPKNFFVPYDKEKVDIANDLYAQLLNNDGNDISELNIIKEQAIQKLDIVLSTKKLYEDLLDYCNPQKFMEPYEHNAIQQANHYYSQVNEYRNQLDKLEELDKDIYGNVVLTAYYSRKKKREEEELRKEKKMKQIQEGTKYEIIFWLIIFAIIALIKTFFK